jgi:uncharacterized Ntn-hydrolase superfamily protein
MTFSIVGRCARTGMFGVAITTSSIAVGARCPHVRAGAGAVATQNVTDPSYGPRILDLMAAGHIAEDALALALQGQPFTDFRQIVVIDRNGATASFSGDKMLGTHANGDDADCAAAGNLLKSVEVPATMTDAFQHHASQHLAERLLRALEAGRDAGGEVGPLHSAALLVAHDLPFPLVDLRCDWDESDPVAKLRSLWIAYEPQMEAYRIRATDPQAAPNYGVPGNT